MSDKKEDTLKKGQKLVADDGSGVEIAYKGAKNDKGQYLVELKRRGKSPVLKRMTSATMHDDGTLDLVKDILNKESKDIPFQVGRFTVTQGPIKPAAKKPAAKKPAAKKSQGGKRRKTKRRKRRRKRKTRRRSRKRKRRTRRRRR